MQSIFHLTGSIKHYKWGGFSFLPRLLGSHNYQHEPFAEYWMGAHPAEPSKITFGDQSLFLADFIRENKQAALGKAAAHFDNLPFLLKILDVRDMLSIQVHPNKKQAVEGYQAENEKAIGLNDPQRNYKDGNHKPELMVALGDFWLLHGFKSKENMIATLQEVPELESFLPAFNNGGYKELYASAFQRPDAGELLKSLAARILPLYDAGKLKKEDADFWAARAIKTFCADGSLDRGIFSIYFLNLVHLKKDEGVFQDAGLPHAYLEGQNVEVMANSDNVLRAGLSHKHVDVQELLNLVKFEATDPVIIKPGKEIKTTYPAPVSEFSLSRIKFAGHGSLNIQPASAAILMVMEGEVKISSGESYILHPGNAVFLMAGTDIQLAGKDTEAFYVTVGEDKFW
jgi:mannose-6-phosphate isomerase